MNEFKENLQVIKESIEDANEHQANPAFISSELVDDQGDPIQENEPEVDNEKDSYNQRNEKGHRKKKTLRNKFDQLLAENRAKDIQLQQSRAYIQEQERRLAEAQAKAEQSAHNSNIYYENSLENDEQRVITELEIAEESGDTRKKIELQKRLAEIAAQKQTLLLSKSLPKQQDQQFQPPPYQEPYYQPPPQTYESPTYQPINEHFEDWIENNSYYDTNSPDFDQELFNEANEIAAILNKRLKFNNASHIIGTPDYFNAISNEMNERYGLSNKSKSDERDDYYEDNIQPYEVAPVTRKGTSMADRYIANKQSHGVARRPRMSLSQDQKDVARGLAATLSKLNDKVGGKQVSIEEAEAIYYENYVNRPWDRERR